MNKKQEIEMMEALFWQQFPEGTKESTLSVERNVLQALWGKGKEKVPLVKFYSSIGIAVGHILQVTCNIYDYVDEEQIKGILYDALNKSYDYYKKNPTSLNLP